MALLFVAEKIEPLKHAALRIIELADQAVSFNSPKGQEVKVIPYGDPANYALIAKSHSAARLNGQPLCTCLRILLHKDEFVFDHQTIYFSAHSSPKVVDYDPGVHGKLRCPICTRALAGRAVRCPRCHHWFHQDDDYPCWSSGGACPTPGCGQQTNLTGEPDWIPDIFLKNQEPEG